MARDNDGDTIKDMRKRIEELENQDVFVLKFGTTNPNGTYEGNPGMFYFDTTLSHLHFCVDGTNWIQL